MAKIGSSEVGVGGWGGGGALITRIPQLYMRE